MSHYATGHSWLRGVVAVADCCMRGLNYPRRAACSTQSKVGERVDINSRHSPIIEADLSLNGAKVVAALERAAKHFGTAGHAGRQRDRVPVEAS